MADTIDWPPRRPPQSRRGRLFLLIVIGVLLLSGGTAVSTFLILYGSFLALKPPKLGELAGLPILINGQPIKLPVEPVIRLVALAGSFVIAAATGGAMMSEWNVLALYWQSGSDAAREPRPIRTASTA